MPSEITNVTGLSGRYAKALFDLADQASVLDAVADDLRKIEVMTAESDDLRRMIRSPVISRLEQSNAVQSLLNKAGASALTKNFLGVVASNRRLFVLADIVKDYLSVLANRRGEKMAEISSAKPLSDIQKADIIATLQNSVGGKVSLNLTVNPELLGGIVVKVGSRMVDASIRTKMQRLKSAMRGVG